MIHANTTITPSNQSELSESVGSEVSAQPRSLLTSARQLVPSCAVGCFLIKAPWPSIVLESGKSPFPEHFIKIRSYLWVIYQQTAIETNQGRRSHDLLPWQRWWALSARPTCFLMYTTLGNVAGESETHTSVHCLPGRHPVTLDNRRHLDGDSGSIVEVFQHVLALRVQGQPARATIWIMMKGSFSPACGDDNQVNWLLVSASDRGKKLHLKGKFRCPNSRP